MSTNHTYTHKARDRLQNTFTHAHTDALTHATQIAADVGFVVTVVATVIPLISGAVDLITESVGATVEFETTQVFVRRARGLSSSFPSVLAMCGVDCVDESASRFFFFFLLFFSTSSSLQMVVMEMLASVSPSPAAPVLSAS